MDAVVLAAGSSNRMGGQDKTLSPLGGEPLIIWSLRAFESSPEVRAVVVTASEANREGVTEAIRKARLRKVTKVVLGGPSRSESVFNGLEALANKGAAFVAIHDGARPFVTAEIICRGVRTARKHGAAVAAVRTVDTVKLGSTGGAVSPAIITGKSSAHRHVKASGLHKRPRSDAWVSFWKRTTATTTGWGSSRTTLHFWNTRESQFTYLSPMSTT